MRGLQLHGGETVIHCCTKRCQCASHTDGADAPIAHKTSPEMEDSEVRNSALQLSTAHGVCGIHVPKASDSANGECAAKARMPAMLNMWKGVKRKNSFIQSVCDVVLREVGASNGE